MYESVIIIKQWSNGSFTKIKYSSFTVFGIALFMYWCTLERDFGSFGTLHISIIPTFSRKTPSN